MPGKPTTVLTTLLALISLRTGLRAQVAEPIAHAGDGWSLAITIDDVPMSGDGTCAAAEVRAVNHALLRVLREEAVPATAFVIPGTPCQGPGTASSMEIAREWREAGHEVGNHSWSHPNYNATTPAAYLADVARADKALAPLIHASGQPERWYRPPLLRTGPTPEKKLALEQWLDSANYRMGVVTIDNQEWVFASAYRRALQDDNDALRDRVVAAYLDHLRESVSYYRTLSQTLFGRDIPQVLLLHANRLNADHLATVLAMLRQEGARFVSLPTATRDPVYRQADSYIGTSGLSWLQRWARARDTPVAQEPRQPAWVDTVASDGVVGTAAVASTPSDTIDATTAAALDAANAAFSAAWLRADSAALVNAYTVDAVVHPPAGGVLVGRPRIGRLWGPSSTDRIGHRIEPMLRRRLGDGLVLEMGRWHSRRRAASGAEEAWLWGCYTVVWKHDVDDRWRMHFDGWSAPHEADWACRPQS